MVRRSSEPFTDAKHRSAVALVNVIAPAAHLQSGAATLGDGAAQRHASQIIVVCQGHDDIAGDRSGGSSRSSPIPPNLRTRDRVLGVALLVGEKFADLFL